MGIVSTSFLFIFLPLSVILYHLIPASRDLYFRNLFLIAVSLFFYAWGEPYYVFFLFALMLLVYIAGKLVDGKGQTRFAKTVVFLTVVTGIGIIVFFKDTTYFLALINRSLHLNLSLPKKGIPLGMNFFVFFAVSYVVDIYRGKCRSPKSFICTALYLSAFFKVTQGPIVEYDLFQRQVETRKTDIEMIYRGVRRFLVGLAKKALIASNLSGIALWVFGDGICERTVVSAWVGCIAYLVEIYFDFSGYSDMACGMALLFGFRLPENFNYPYISRSVTEYWQRWHMTLIQWLKDYLYYPIALGPSVRFRKFLIRHKVNKKTAQKLQNVFVPACIWIPTALWHGTNLNYLLWGVLNCAICILEAHKSPSGKVHTKNAGGWVYTILFLILTKPLVISENIGSALAYYGTMFGISHNAFFDDTTLFLLKEYGVFLAAGILFCFPVRKAVHRLMADAGVKIPEFAEDAALIVLSVVSIAFVIKTGSVMFIYQMF